jgi:hypothetical protein
MSEMPSISGIIRSMMRKSKVSRDIISKASDPFFATFVVYHFALK